MENGEPSLTEEMKGLSLRRAEGFPHRKAEGNLLTKNQKQKG